MFHVLVATHYYQKSPLEPINLYLTCLNHPVNWKTCKVHNLQPFEISNYHLYCTVFVKKKPIPLITGKIASFTIRQSFSHWHSMSKDGQQMMPMHVTLKVGVKCRVITSIVPPMPNCTHFSLSNKDFPNFIDGSNNGELDWQNFKRMKVWMS